VVKKQSLTQTKRMMDTT